MSAEDGEFSRHGCKYQERHPSTGWGSNESSSVSCSASPYHTSGGLSRNHKLGQEKWNIAAYFKKKFENHGKVGSSGFHDLQAGQAFQEPLCTLKNTFLSTQSDDLICNPQQAEFLSSYFEPEIYDVEGYREPCYLDLFEPGVHVIRDPKLDQSPPTLKEKLQPYFESVMKFLSSTQFIVGCSVALLIAVIVIAATLAANRILDYQPKDPRITPPYVVTATSCGLVKGKIKGKAYIFLGIPFALSPVGKYRLKPPRKLSSLQHCWSDVYTANISRPCWTYNKEGAVVQGDEDCLLLDIYTPKLGYENPVPVIIYIGGQSLGNDDRRKKLLRNAASLVVERNVVIISPQIRRGALGFLPSPIVASSVYPHTSGNQGSADLFLVLEWIRDNVEHFGGDNCRITVLAHEAGASLLWPMINKAHSMGLLHTVWMTGAAPVHPTVTWREALPSLSRPYKCTSFECITNATVTQWMKSIPREWRRSDGRPWLVADGVYVPFEFEPPRVPIVFGSTEQSAAEYLLHWRQKLTSNVDIKSAVFQILKERASFNYNNGVVRNGTQKNMIFTEEDASKTLSNYSLLKNYPWLLLTTLISDATVTCPLLSTAFTLAQSWAYSVPTSVQFTPPVYAYISRYKRTSPSDNIADSLSDIESILGVFKTRSKKDINFSKTIQDLFFTFVETGSPERHLAVPAHYGIYIIKSSFKVEKEFENCIHWENFHHLARLF